MLSVTNLAGQSEPITKYSKYERHEEVNGSLELSFSSFFHDENPGHELIDEESIIEKDGYEFRVKQLSANRLSKQVVAISTFFDLNHVLREDIFGGTKTFNELASWLFTGTGWTYENVDVTGSRLAPNFGDGNVIALTKILTTVFECEYQILPGKVVRFANQVGADNDAQYRYGNNIKALSKKVDTTKLRTRIKGIGGNGLVVTYTSPNSSIFGIRDAGTVSDERYTIADSLAEYIKRQLIDYPEVAIELDAIELQQKEVGERVWLIYEPLGIEFQTRVLAKTSRIPEIKSSVIIGNAIPQSLSDILTSTKIDIDVNKKETRSNFEQTNERFLLEVERVDGSIAFLVIEADEIRTEVSGKVDNDTFNSTVSQLSDNISSKVTQNISGAEAIFSLFEQTASEIKLQANKIQLLGITNVAETLNIGANFADSGLKKIQFRGDLGGVSIVSPAGTNGLRVAADLGALNLVSSPTGGVFANSQRLDNLSSQFASLNHGHTTNPAGSHNHGIPDGTILQKADGGTVTYRTVGGHIHTT